MNRHLHPPRIAAWFVGRMFPDNGGSSILGDMIETYRYFADDHGILKARIWFWGQCIKAIPYYVIDELYWRILMFKNYILVTVRNLKKNSTYSWLNIIGLAVGMAAFVLIALYVQYELSFDNYHENSERIYRAVREDRAFTPAPLGPALKEKIPEVASVARILRSGNTLVSHQHHHFLEKEFYWIDPEALDIFSLPLISGDPETALKDPYAILLSQRTAKKYFGNADPLGKTLTMNESNEFKVTGVIDDMPANSHFIMDFMVPYKTFFRITDSDITNWTANFSYTYFLLSEGADPKKTQNKIHPVIEIPLLEAAGFQEPYPEIYSIQPLTEIHLHSHRMQEIGVNNDIKTIILFSAIAFLILFIACINYMNLATARSLRRSKEVGMRKVVGAQKGQLIGQFLGESVTMAFLALILSIMMVVIALPVFSSLVERQLEFDPIHNPGLFLGLVFITLFTGLFAGSYPALKMSGFRPISVLSKTFTRSPKGLSLRNVLVMIQFAITIILIICTTAVRKQLQFIKTMNLGYAKEQIITIPVQEGSIHRNIGPIKTELLQHSDIIAVSTSGCLPNNIDTFTSRDWTGRNPDEPIPIFYNTADYDFIDLYELQIVQGRNFSREFPSDEKGVFLVNETAVKVAEWKSPIGREFTHWSGEKGRIVGIIKDFHLHSLHRPIAPLYVFLTPRKFSNISIKMNPTNISASIAYIEGVLKRFAPSYPFSYSFFDELFERAYFAEQRMGRIFSAFSILAIFIACLGLFGLTTFAAEQRTKEMGIRKVLGASESNIFLQLSKEFIRWVLLANLIAWPFAYFAMNRWLQNFAYRIHIGITAYLISGGTALLIAYLTVCYQSIKSAQTNPVDSLRYE